jgi:histidine triad (HIT) family protein
MSSSHSDCLFCKIIAGEIPAKIAYQDDRSFAFYDISPQAPKHVLVLPRQHIGALAEISKDDCNLAGHLLHVAAQVAKQEGLHGGFRVVINNGDDGGQTVGHLHLHVLGGRAMHWPPG